MSARIVDKLFTPSRGSGPSNAAKQAVMNSPELFELVLLALPRRTLLVTAPLVCKRWRDTIDTSPALQQHLFFRPMAQPSEFETAKRQINPLLAEVFAPFFTNDGNCAISVSQLESTPLATDRSAFLEREDASWRRMLVQQPPGIELPFLIVDKVSRCRTFPLFQYHRCWYRREPGQGICMGELYDAVWSWLEYERRGVTILYADGSHEMHAGDEGPDSLCLAHSAAWKQKVWRLIQDMMLKAGLVVIEERSYQAMSGNHGGKRKDWEDFKSVACINMAWDSVNMHHEPEEWSPSSGEPSDEEE